MGLSLTNMSESRRQGLHSEPCLHNPCTLLFSVPAVNCHGVVAGLNALGLSISRVQVDGHDAEHDLHTYLHGPLPASLTRESPGAAFLPAVLHLNSFISPELSTDKSQGSRKPKAVLMLHSTCRP